MTGDFPDTISDQKTPVIKRLIDLTCEDFSHRVISINRVSPSAQSMARQLSPRAPFDVNSEPSPYGTTAAYQAPGKGIFHKAALNKLGDWLAVRIEELNEKPSLLIAHKLTIEGIAVERAALKLKIPYAITVQSHTDERILRLRPDLESTFSRIYRQAELVVFFSPRARRRVETKLRKRVGLTRVIPCPTDLDSPQEPVASNSGLLSVFHLKNRKIKNLEGMVKGVRYAQAQSTPIRLNVAGGGSERDIRACRKIIGRNPGISLIGPLDRPRIQERMNAASAFVMPSISETFGLVFVEALFAGLPIIYPTGRAVDGYFDGCDFARGVDPLDHRATADAMIWATQNELELKNALAEWQKSKEAGRFTQKQIAADYACALRAACEGQS